jgi:hypothetical protein
VEDDDVRLRVAPPAPSAAATKAVIMVVDGAMAGVQHGNGEPAQPAAAPTAAAIRARAGSAAAEQRLLPPSRKIYRSSALPKLQIPAAMLLTS